MVKKKDGWVGFEKLPAWALYCESRDFKLLRLNSYTLTCAEPAVHVLPAAVWELPANSVTLGCLRGPRLPGGWRMSQSEQYTKERKTWMDGWEDGIEHDGGDIILIQSRGLSSALYVYHPENRKWGACCDEWCDCDMNKGCHTLMLHLACVCVCVHILHHSLHMKMTRMIHAPPHTHTHTHTLLV